MAIVLIGFMGVGKSTVGQRLATRLGLPFHDSDVAFEQAHALSPGSYLTRHPEDHFRAREADIVEHLLRDERQAVVSLGGGAITTARVRAALVGHEVVWLHLPLEHIAERPGVTKGRPLFTDDRVAERFATRQPLYRDLATITVDAGAPTPDLVVDKIMQFLPGKREM